jgi:tRNA pseudouridine38-40 synthase
MRIALGLEYDGSGFCGWQTQPSGCAVQDALERALSEVAAESIQTQSAGRTDAGVHALAQVVHFDTNARRPLTAWVRGVNTLLPRTIAVNWAHPVPDSFHARFSARGRAYRYLLLNRPERPGLRAQHVGWHHRPLDLARMREGGRHLLGTHDFSAFRAAECQARSPVKELRRAGIERAGDLVVFDFAADAFLHHMVRNLVGSLVKVGNGSRPPAWIGEVLAGCDRGRAAPTYPASGLYLTEVEYEAAWGLPAGRSCPPIELLAPHPGPLPRSAAERAEPPTLTDPRS